MVGGKRVITVRGSKEYMAKVFRCWEDVDSHIGLLEGNVILSEGDQLRFDAWIGKDSNTTANYLIMVDDPQKVGLLVWFLKGQEETIRKYSERIELILKVHASQVRDRFRGWSVLNEVAQAYTEYMEGFLQFTVSSIVKTLTLLLDEDLRVRIGELEEAVNPLKMDLEKAPRQILYQVLMDNVWRRSVGFRLPKTPHGLDQAVEEVEAALGTMVDAVKKPDLNSITRAAQALTSLSLRITNLNPQERQRKAEQPAIYA